MLMELYVGITLDEYNCLFAIQNGCCAICGTHQTQQKGFSMAVDHCHQGNKIRGLLCFLCNTAIGRFNDNPELIEKALRYLKNAKS